MEEEKIVTLSLEYGFKIWQELSPCEDFISCVEVARDAIHGAQGRTRARKKKK